MVDSPDCDTEFFEIITGVLKGDTLASYLCWHKTKDYCTGTMVDEDNADNLTLLENTSTQAGVQHYSLMQTPRNIGQYVNVYNQNFSVSHEMDLSPLLSATPLKFVNHFKYIKIFVFSNTSRSLSYP